MLEVRGVLFCFVLPLIVLSCQFYQILKGGCGLGAQRAARLFRRQAPSHSPRPQTRRALMISSFVMFHFLLSHFRRDRIPRHDINIAEGKRPVGIYGLDVSQHEVIIQRVELG